jgi:NAD(P)-dependent dehydrogenase (short-subunit alcohol dehydrogenase family)
VSEPTEPDRATAGSTGAGLSASPARSPAKDGRATDSAPAARAGGDTRISRDGKPLTGKVAFVAGASRGIGAAIAATLAAQGASVAVAARSEETGRVPGTIHEVAGRIAAAGGRALPVPCDVTNEESVQAALATTVTELGGIDILVANAGVLWLGPVESTPLKRWQLCLDVNLTGVFLVTREAIPYIRARGGGSLIAVTTTGVNMTDRGSNAYWVSKAAVERLYLGLAADLRPDNIAVNCLSPARVVLTEGWQAAGGGEIPADMVEPPETMGRAAALLAAQDGAGITGTVQRSETLLATM